MDVFRIVVIYWFFTTLILGFIIHILRFNIYDRVKNPDSRIIYILNRREKVGFVAYLFLLSMFVNFCILFLSAIASFYYFIIKGMV